MKRASAILLCLITGLILIGSCNDDLTGVGLTIQPPGDTITVYLDSFQIEASTIQLDSIYAKTSDCLLGEMYDPVYGIIKADFLCQFYCEEGFTFNQNYPPLNHTIDSAELFIIHSTSGRLYAWGDTLTPMEITVYPVIKPLKRNFYTNDNPEQYCDMSNPLGSNTYTLFDLTVTDSVRNLEGYSPYIRVKLPTELGQKFYDETRNNPSTFSNQNTFNEFFPGIYITNTFGSGCLVGTSGEYIAMRFFYNTVIEAESEDDPSDTLRVAAQYFYVSKDVVQINRFKNSRLEQLFEENPNHAFVQSLAGVCTKLVIPTTEIAKKLDINNRYINSFSLNLKYLPQEDWSYAYYPPSHLLLIPMDSVATFFENGSVQNDSTTFISYAPDLITDYGQSYYTNAYETNYGFSPYSRTYSFGNISRLLKQHIENSPDRDLSLLAIPVTRKTTSYSSNNTTYYYTTAISHSFSISGAKIRKDGDFMKIYLLSSEYKTR